MAGLELAMANSGPKYGLLNPAQGLRLDTGEGVSEITPKGTDAGSSLGRAPSARQGKQLHRRWAFSRTYPQLTNDMPQLIKALLLGPVEHAPGASRFINGDWSQIDIMVPIIGRLVSAIGWSTFVMQNFLTLCERAGLAYPLDKFGSQVEAVTASLSNAQGSWVAPPGCCAQLSVHQCAKLLARAIRRR